MRSRGWLDGFNDSWDELGKPLGEMISNIEGSDRITDLYVADMEMLRTLGL